LQIAFRRDRDLHDFAFDTKRQSTRERWVWICSIYQQDSNGPLAFAWREA
jgi:hypothetical protein